MRGQVLDFLLWGVPFYRVPPCGAGYFARGGSSSQWPRPPSLVPSGQFTLSPLHSVSAWRRKLRSFPCPSSSRKTRCAGLRREQRGIGQNAAGDAADGLRLRFAPPRSIGLLSPDPCLRGLPLGRCAALPARNTRSAWVAIPSGPTGGLSGKKIGTGAVLFLRLPLPNQRSRPVFSCRGGLWPPAPEVSDACRAGACPRRRVCRARPPGRAVPPTDGRPQGLPLQGCKNLYKPGN